MEALTHIRIPHFPNKQNSHRPVQGAGLSVVFKEYLMVRQTACMFCSITERVRDRKAKCLQADLHQNMYLLWALLCPYF